MCVYLAYIGGIDGTILLALDDQIVRLHICVLDFYAVLGARCSARLYLTLILLRCLV